MHKAFFNIHNFLQSHKSLGVSLLLVYLLITGFLAWNIHLEEDVTKLIPSGEKQDLLKEILEVTDLSDKLIINIEGDTEKVPTDSLVSYAESFTLQLEQRFPEYINEIKGKVPEKDIQQVYSFVYKNLPIFLQPADYLKIEKRIAEDSIERYMESGYRQLMSPTGFVTKNYFLNDPLSFTGIGLNKLQELQVGDHFGIYNNYLVTKDRKHILLFLDLSIPASETSKNEVFIAELNKLIIDLHAHHPEIKTEYFGGMLYSLANANRIKKDILLTIGVAVLILLILLIFFYRKFYIPVVLFLPSIVAGLSAIAILSVFKGSVSAISLGIGAILLGISLDYSLHILTHFRNNKDPEKLYKDITRPILMSSFTTAVAFLCLLFVQSEALRDLGVFASISILLSSFFALVGIPLLYRPTGREHVTTFLDKIAARDYSKHRYLVYGITALFVVSLFLFHKVKFNNDLSKINYQPKEIKALEVKLEGLAGREGKNIYMVAYGSSVDMALQANNELYHRLQKMKSEGEITNYSSIGGVILSTMTQDQRIEYWDQYWNLQRIDSLKEKIGRKALELGFREGTFDQFYKQLETDYKNIDLDDYKNAGSLYLNDFISEGESLATVTSTVNLNEENAEDFLTAFQEDSGILALDRKVLNQGFLGNLKEDFNKLILISILAVFGILLLFYRNLEISLLTIFPIGVTWVIALGLMHILNLEFNILNIIISTFVFGLGLDYSIFMTNACLEEYETQKPVLKTYQTSIILSVITTLLGMGALIFAQHPALRSISVVSIIGVVSALMVSFVIQRSIFRLLLDRRMENGKFPLHFSQLVHFGATESESEKLYKKRAILNNYRYKSVYRKVKHEFGVIREKNLRLSEYLHEGEKVTVINANYGIIPLYLSYKFEEMQIGAVENDPEKFEILQGLPKVKSGEIKLVKRLDELETPEVLVIEGNVNEPEILKKLAKQHAKKVIFVNSDFPSRWLLDHNFEIIYRQNNILVYRKMD